MAHQKHAKLKRPAIGFFHRIEWAILGAPCSRIDILIQELCARLTPNVLMGYLDADHHATDLPTGLLHAGVAMAVTNKIDYYRWDIKQEPTAFESKQAFRKLELLLVNGNHFQAKKQILILDERKFDSLQRKKDRLTDVALILTSPELNQLPDFLQDHLPDVADIPRLAFSDFDAIAEFLKQETIKQQATLKGLVLAGGKSQRMGTDKGELVYHKEQTQQQYLYELLQRFCPEVYLSCRPDQEERLQANFQTLPDRFQGLGPFAAILSAFQLDPDAAWLVVACDLPFVDQEAIRQLIAQRDSAKNATAFHNPDSGFPEPLITIWEPRVYPDLLHFLSLGYSCPRKVLINTDVHQIQANNPNWIKNVNTPEELEQARLDLQK
ncbi:MAG: NTP transferase domain-containing protein [Saprospiraceae bacterium]|nr:NTP transferase domain-containing protein [Saprospiraceae bacterium]